MDMYYIRHFYSRIFIFILSFFYKTYTITRFLLAAVDFLAQIYLTSPIRGGVTADAVASFESVMMISKINNFRIWIWMFSMKSNYGTHPCARIRRSLHKTRTQLGVCKKCIYIYIGVGVIWNADILMNPRDAGLYLVCVCNVLRSMEMSDI